MIEFYRRTGFLTTTAALNIQIESIQEIKWNASHQGALQDETSNIICLLRP